MRGVGRILGGLLVLVSCDAADDPATTTPSEPATSPVESVESSADDAFECGEEALTGGDDDFLFTAAHRVVDGALGELCFGEEEPTLLAAWDDLATITPAVQLGDLVVFAGYEPNDDSVSDVSHPRRQEETRTTDLPLPRRRSRRR
jgi:hypothetical protein